MKPICPVLLSLAGFAMLFSQTTVKSLSLKQSIQQLPAVNNVPQSVRTDIVRAQTQILKQQDVLLKASELAKTDPLAQQQAQDAQRKLEEAQKAAAAVAKQAERLPDAPKFVSAPQRQHLMDLVN